MNDAVQAYIEGIDPARRPLFDRVHHLILHEFPGVDVVISYNMPTYVLGDFRVYVAAWKHGLSIYGWGQGQDGGFTDRHPDLLTHKGTIKLPPKAAAEIADDEFVDLFRHALGAAA